MFYDEIQAIEKCEEEPSQIFNLIDEGHLETLEKILRKKWASVNITNSHDDDILSYLLEKGHYETVLKLMKKQDWNVNHQNKDGNTFAHILVSKKYLEVIDITKELYKNKRFIPNIRNKNGETILDISLYKDNIYTAVKILKDKRFNNIDLMSFKNLYEKYVKNDKYGTYSKINNLQVIIDNLKDRQLLPKLNKVIDTLSNDLNDIKKSLKQGNIETLDNVIYNVLDN
ncbi:MAG: ankyrin repeat domain-containing protein [Bacilli bacterium]|nr:ankyrin repeat domain-containing protein [Bacilli bacterium]